MHYILTWKSSGDEAMRTEFRSAEDTLRHACDIGAPAVRISILAGGQTLTFDELRRIVAVSRKA
jgi:hypothetical protein